MKYGIDLDFDELTQQARLFTSHAEHSSALPAPVHLRGKLTKYYGFPETNGFFVFEEGRPTSQVQLVRPLPL